MTKYTEKEIEWAIEELKKKHPERANREQAISLLDTLKGLPIINSSSLGLILYLDYPIIATYGY